MLRFLRGGPNGSSFSSFASEVSRSTVASMPPQTPAAVPGAPQPQSAPFGSTPATGPTPNRGYEAAGLQRLGSVVKQLEELIPLVGAASEPGREVLKALGILVKLVPAGSQSPAAQRNNIEQMAMRNTRDNQQMKQLEQMRMQSAQGGQGAGQAQGQAA